MHQRYPATLTFSLFNSLSESADWGVELVAIESMSLVPVVGGKLQFIVECKVRKLRSDNYLQ